MFEYSYPSDKAQAKTPKLQKHHDRRVSVGLKKAMAVEKLTLQALKAQIIKEWTRTDTERSAAQSCPGAQVQLRVTAVLTDAMCYQVCERSAGQTTIVPLRFWWAWVVRPDVAWGQYCLWPPVDRSSYEWAQRQTTFICHMSGQSKEGG